MQCDVPDGFQPLVSPPFLLVVELNFEPQAVPYLAEVRKRK